MRHCVCVWGWDGSRGSEGVEHPAYFFVGSDACGHEWEPELVFDISHGVEHAFHSGGVAVDKEEGKELGEAVVDGAGAVVVAFKGEAHHL